MANARSTRQGKVVVPDYPAESLQGIRLRYLRENHQKNYRDMVKRGILEDHLENMKRITLNAKQRYLDEGAPSEEVALNWAIRSVLLDSQPD